MSEETKAVEVLHSGRVLLPRAAIDDKLPARYSNIYRELLTQALREFPPIEGYETTHTLLMERFVFFYTRQKMIENEPANIFDGKRYSLDIRAFLKTADALLKEARSISAETTFKHNFVRTVVEVIHRCLPDSDQKYLVIQELQKLAQT